MFLVSSCSRLSPIHWRRALSWERKCCWSSADRRCSNYICVIDNFITYLVDLNSLHHASFDAVLTLSNSMQYINTCQFIQPYHLQLDSNDLWDDNCWLKWRPHLYVFNPICRSIKIYIFRDKVFLSNPLITYVTKKSHLYCWRILLKTRHGNACDILHSSRSHFTHTIGHRFKAYNYITVKKRA